MRVCFDTLCFSSRPHAADEEATPGLGSTALNVLIDHQITSEMGSVVHELQALLQVKEDKIRELETLLHIRDEEIEDLRSHLDKFQSVFPFHFNAATPKHKGLNNNIGGTRPRKQRAGISAEPQSEASLQELSRQTFPIHDKAERSRELIKAAILDNDFMKNLELTQIREIVDCMYPEAYKAQSIIIKEGDVGSIVYVLEGKSNLRRNGVSLIGQVSYTRTTDLQAWSVLFVALNISLQDRYDIQAKANWVQHLDADVSKSNKTNIAPQITMIKKEGHPTNPYGEA
ncbi:hypothetical protein FQR65_LT10991 [Abscondita terminalis]|nr:hypothetical protein FQR65_LT10991 [Abscondita terminalis]